MDCSHKATTDADGEIFCQLCGQVLDYVIKEEPKYNDEGVSNIGPATNRLSLPDSVRLGSAPPPFTKKKYWLRIP
jgi:hypothetical protein